MPVSPARQCQGPRRELPGRVCLSTPIHANPASSPKGQDGAGQRPQEEAGALRETWARVSGPWLRERSESVSRVMQGVGFYLPLTETWLFLVGRGSDGPCRSVWTWEKTASQDRQPSTQQGHLGPCSSVPGSMAWAAAAASSSPGSPEHLLPQPRQGQVPASTVAIYDWGEQWAAGGVRSAQACSPVCT